VYKEKRACCCSPSFLFVINDVFPKIDLLAKQIFAAISKGEELKTQLMALKKLARYTPINCIDLRREIADSTIPTASYHMTKRQIQQHYRRSNRWT
jgi:hypothetical protein